MSAEGCVVFGGTSTSLYPSLQSLMAGGVSNRGRNLAVELGERPAIADPTIDNVRSTCSAVASSRGCQIQIDHDRARSVINKTPLEAITASSHFMAVDAQFDSLESELNFHMVLHLLNFGHGFRHPLHTHTGKGAWQTIKSGVERWHAESDGLDASALASLTPDSAARLFALGSGQAGDVPPALVPLVDMLVCVANTTAAELGTTHDPSLASFVTRTIAEDIESAHPACRLVGRLAGSFRAFDDRRRWHDGADVVFLKKAQIAVAEVHQVMGPRFPALRFGDVERFTVVCDNVLPSVLRTLGVLRLPETLAERIDARVHIPAGPEEAELRACAIAAAETMIGHGGGRFWAKQLGDYLWTLGKAPEFRKVERHATVDTIYY